MKITELAIDHPRPVVVATFLVLVMAVFAALSIPVQRTPAITKAVVLVIIYIAAEVGGCDFTKWTSTVPSN